MSFCGFGRFGNFLVLGIGWRMGALGSFRVGSFLKGVFLKFCIRGFLVEYFY